MYKVLVVDDEPKITELLRVCLGMQGMEVVCAQDGNEALEIFAQDKFDIVLTDIMMPECDGYELVTKLREKSNVPVMFLTAKADILDRVKGLSLGADDYIVKPFDPLEAAARVSANLRRCYGYDRESNDITEDVKISCGDLELNRTSRVLYKSGKIVELTALEYKMVEYLMVNKGRVLTKNQIFEAVWDTDIIPDDNSIMVAISKLRSKISDDKGDHIKTIRGLGYRMED